MPLHECAIVGAGIHGLCTAFWLRMNGVERVIVLDQHGPGHAHGSSHGATRITRLSYEDPALVTLAARAHDEGWPPLERALGRALRVPTPGLFFGPADGPIADYVQATAAAARGLVEPIPAGDAQRRFPLLRIDARDTVLADRSAAVVLAADTMASLRQWLSTNGVELRWNSVVQAIEPHGDGVALATAGGAVVARRAVLACGPWTGRLHGGAPATTLLRQEVGYVDLRASAAACSAGAFPVWAHLGRGPHAFTYGLPSHAGGGLKIARHRTEGAGDDPDAEPPPIDDGALLALARERFRADVLSLRATERCLYTMTADHRFTVARADDLPLVHVAACSGHAFKFGPLIGKQAAELAATIR